MLLTLNLRDCWLGPKYSGKVENIEGRKIRPLTYEIDSLMLQPRELNALLALPDAWDRLYRTMDDGGVVPFMDCFKSLEFCAKVKGASVRVQYGNEFEHEQTFSDCVLFPIKLVLVDGGETAFNCRIKTKPQFQDALGELFEYFDEKIRAELIFIPPRAQIDLPLNRAGLGEAPQDPKRAKAAAAVKRKPRAKRGNGARPLQ